MATTEKMTVHRALAELKVIDDRIISAINSGKYCAANQHNNKKINGKEVEEAMKDMHGAYDKVTDLIKRRNALKRAVVLSNAKTIVKINEAEYTVAEAIDMKNCGMVYKTNLLQALRLQYSKAIADINKQNSTLEERADKSAIAVYGASESKTKSDDYKKHVETYVEKNAYELVDPIDICKKIEELEAEIAAYDAEVDAALSVSNAITEIEFAY